MTESFRPPFGSREERIAYNEDWARSLNRRRAEWLGGPETDFRCECSQAECTETIPLSGEEWKMVRAKPNRFAVAPDHVAESFEGVVKEFPRFWLIEKLGEAGAIAAELETRPGPSAAGE
jgi:hypothetical protein